MSRVFGFLDPLNPKLFLLTNSDPKAPLRREALGLKAQDFGFGDSEFGV